MTSGRRNILLSCLAILGALGVGIGIGAGIWKEEESNSDVSSTTQPTTETTTKTTAETTTLPNDGTIEYQNDVFGTLRGLRDDKYDVVTFLGVPYAENPVRFAAPVMKIPDGILTDGTEPGLNCRSPLPSGVTEDCLHSNIYVPKAAMDGKESLAVMVYIHGGAFWTGSNDADITNGQYLADEQNIIVVKINYRLAAFGFWLLEDKDENGFQTNWGLLDQRMALEWVQTYIGHFGGDAQRVTISGCSAGGQSVLIHTLSPDSWPLFHRAASFSGPFGMPFHDIKNATEIYRKAAEELKCVIDGKTDVSCLRSKSTEEIWDATMKIRNLLHNVLGDVIDSGILTQAAEPYAPVIDGKVLDKHPFHLMREGKMKPDTKLVVEYTANEGEEFVQEILYPLGEEDAILQNRESRLPLKWWEYMMYKQYGMKNGTKVLEMYDCNNKCDGAQKCDCGDDADLWMTGWVWSCHLRAALEDLTDNKNVFPVHMNYFYPAEYEITYGGDFNCHEKACHCVGEWWLFGGSRRRDFKNETDLNFGTSYRNLYGEFVRTGAVSELQSWSEMAKEKKFNYLETFPVSQRSVFREECDLYDIFDNWLTI